MITWVAGEGLPGLCVPIFVFGEENGAQAQATPLVPLPVGGNDRIRNDAMFHHFFNGRLVIQNGFAVGSPAVDPAIPPAADDVPIPFTFRVVGRNRLATGVEVLVILDVFPIFLFRRHAAESIQVLAAWQCRRTIRCG